MHPATDDDGDVARSARAIRSLAEGSAASLQHVSDLFAAEFSRLEQNAKVRKYLHVLATAKVRAMLSRLAHARRTSSSGILPRPPKELDEAPGATLP